MSEQALRAGGRTPQLTGLLRFEADRARRFYRESMPLIAMVHQDSRASLRALISIYAGLLGRIEQSDYDVFTRRIALPAWEKLWIAARAALASPNFGR